MFYILTCGSTASVWLSRVLTHHPEIVCFHGTKAIPAGATRDPSEPLARQFVRELGHLYWLSQGEQVFGSVHGFAAREIAPEITAVEGAFATMIRHPVTRLNSLFHRAAEALGTVALPDDDIYRPFRDNQQDPDRIDGTVFTPYVRQFHDLCHNALTEDTFILEHMDERDTFRYEKIVVDPAYFRACFERLAEGCRHAMDVRTTRRGAVRLDCGDAYLERVFQMGNVNRKTSGDGLADGIVAQWPPLFRTIFIDELERQGGKNAADRYAAFGYQLPDGLLPPSVQKSATRSVPPGSSMPDVHEPNAPMARAEPERSNARTSPPSADGLPPAKAKGAAAPVQHMLAIIEMERRTHAAQISELEDRLAAEQDAFATHSRELQDTLDAEREAFTSRIHELQHTLDAEREAFGSRIKELLDTLAAERAAFGARIHELLDTLALERDASAARIHELQDTLAAERDAFGARIKELEDGAAAEQPATSWARLGAVAVSGRVRKKKQSGR